MRNESFRFGDWQVSPATNSLTRGEMRQQVEPRAMDVLVALCRRASDVISAEELLRQCWGDAFTGDNPVHKTIAQLRRVLGDNASEPTYIETIRKRGYRTVAPITHPDGGLATAESGAWQAGSPFRGLQAFDEAHASVFFGRNDATYTLLQSVDAQSQAGRALQLVLGPSGCGKTSLIRAGVLPALMRPSGFGSLQVPSSTLLDMGELGEQPLRAALASALLDWEVDEQEVFPGTSADALGRRLEESFNTVAAELAHAALLRQGQPRPGEAGARRFAVVIDRMEAVFTAAHVSEAERRSFFGVLDALARNPHVLVIAACRNDFYPRLAEYPQLMEGKLHGGHYDLGPPTHAEVAQIIRLPAVAANLTFGVDLRTQTRLDDVLCEHAVASPDALPLLQYTLQELYLQRTPAGELSFEAFHRLGGIEGAIGQRAEEVIAALSEAQRGCLPRVLSLLVTLSADEDAVTSRRAPWSALRSEDERVLVQALVESRLFVSELIGSESGFGVAHEAILRRWPRVTEWIDLHRHALRIRGRVAALAARWAAEGRPQDLLLPRGKQLSEARELLDLAAFSLSDDELALIRVSIKRARLREQLRIAAMTAIVLLSVVAFAMGVLARRAEHLAQQRRAEAEGLMGFMVGDFVDKLRPLGRLDLLDSVGAKALTYLSDSSGDDLNDVSLLQRAKALQVLGEVKIARGDPAEAERALKGAREVLEEVLERGPKNKEVLKSLGAVTFWLGQIELDQNRWDLAEEFFGDYREFSDRLAGLDPDDVDAWIEQSYAHSSLGAVALKKGNVQIAAKEFEKSVELKVRALQKKPKDTDLVVALANGLSWQASALELLGQFQAAMDLYDRELNTLKELHESSQEVVWASRLAIAYQHKARLEVAMGRNQDALSNFRLANGLHKLTIDHEPENLRWQVERMYVELEEIRIRLDKKSAAEFLPRLYSIVGRMEELTRRDSKNADWSRQESISRRRLAEALLLIQDSKGAVRYASESKAELEKLLAANSGNMMARQELANTLLVLAQAQDHEGKKDVARGLCVTARDLLVREVSKTIDYRFLDPWVRAHVCLDRRSEITEVLSSLERIGYRDAAYLFALSEH
ncbi:nSTAND1 domain-containing NTPase [Chitinimonas koreensis]|uniref:nSTAND1 domain-containing NTPase n=1 Tax=Chitinimonas koreensis TaxID=356302 RepID=UPI000411DB98|nr:winged helix-turn-helix domain-containing protein [Chitinimonas koreensis]QNM97419.1 winged helix-turn-helix domain-containing protein [Chitinimonas koreensis]